MDEGWSGWSLCYVTSHRAGNNNSEGTTARLRRGSGISSLFRPDAVVRFSLKNSGSSIIA